MICITCPFCGPRDHVEYVYGGDATKRRPLPDAPLSAWHGYVYLRDNPRGAHRELWHHVGGCRQWLVVERDTLTHRIGPVQFARTGQASEAAAK